MSQQLPSFQQYQLAFTQHLRNPKLPHPKNTAVKGLAIYEEIVFNNVLESVSACFPVAQKVLGKRAWLQLVRGFFREHSANSPIFRHIPEEFLGYLSTQDNSPVYLNNLCHYEWVELAVSGDNTTIDSVPIDSMGDLLEKRPVFNPAMHLLNYDYDVQNISLHYKPKVPVSTQLLVYRDAQDAVKFLELNTITFQLVALLQENNLTGIKALIQISRDLEHPEPDSVIQFGFEILQDFNRLGIILGVDAVAI
ncbi:MAG: putative DNA-binding domain-containing protein [Methylotenera sp.]|nr:putative DNA-binding domain-containing protein [Methylotenera sp.]